MIEKDQTVLVSKYALTDGIVKAKVKDAWCSKGYVYAEGYGWNALKLGRDAHLTERDALVAAEEMRARKIKSLQKTIGRLEALNFAPKGG